MTNDRSSAAPSNAADQAALGERLIELGELADRQIRDLIQQRVSPDGHRLAAMLEYHLGWRGTDLEALDSPVRAGKKLRPALVLLVSEAVGGEISPAARRAAAAVELLHNFSLVHDDIQDHSELRRHRPTLWSVWGMPQGINAGDALFALAQLALLAERSALSASMAAELNASALLLSEGQFLDIELQLGKLAVAIETYETMITRKTGELFACACRLGAMAAGATPAAIEAYAAYGRELGVAFQEQDDLLGVWGQPQETGKPAAADIVERKRGLPAAMALSRADAPDWLRAAYASTDTPLSSALVAGIIAHFDALELRSAIAQRVQARYDAALRALSLAGAREPARGYLAAVCEALISRRT